jgi:hypothetical protein
MSVEAISWALNLAPVPADRRGQPSSACKFVLVGLANHAGPDGSGAFPSVATLVRYTGLSERTVRTCLDRLEAGGIIRPFDPDLLAARIKRADRRPQGWDLDLTLARDDLNEPGVTVPESQSPVRRAGLAPIERPHHERPPNGVQPPHPAGLMDHLDHEVQQLHLAAATRCNQGTGGVQPTRPRGAAVAPEPSTESSLKPSAAPVPVHLRHRCTAVTDCERHQSCVQTGFTLSLPIICSAQCLGVGATSHADRPDLDGPGCLTSISQPPIRRFGWCRQRGEIAVGSRGELGRQGSSCRREALDREAWGWVRRPHSSWARWRVR